jgi:predicted permease
VLAQEYLGVWQGVRLDARVLAATMDVSLITSVLFGLLPALDASRMDVRSGLAEGGGRAVAGGASRWPRRLLVVAEVALGVVLLVGAGLLVRTFAYLRGLRPGFDPTNVITASLSLQDARYQSSLRVEQLAEESLARIRQLPGVEAAAMGLSLPYERPLNMSYRLVGGPNANGQLEITNLTYVTTDYFRALRIPVLRGRDFDRRDVRGSMLVAIVNESFVKKRLPNQDPLGSQIVFREVESGGRSRVIVGVAGDVQQRPGWGEFVPLSPMPNVFIPVSQTSDKFLQLVHTWFSPSWIVRSPAPSGALIAGIQRAVEAVDPMLPFAGFRTLDEIRARSLAPQRMQAILLGSLAGLALLLAAVGIYGLIANSVAERTRELGIRMALGATASHAIRAMALPGIVLALAGVAIGCLLARFAAQVLQHAVWGIQTTDAVTFAGVSLGLLAVAAAASLVPALRIARLSPAETLREE